MEGLMKIPTNKCYLNVELNNYGDYQLPNVKIKYSEDLGLKGGVRLDSMLFDSTLTPKYYKKFYSKFLEDLKIESKEPTAEEPDLNYNYFQEYAVDIIVSWRTTTYIYTYHVKGSGTRKLYVEDFYTYNGTKFTKRELIKQLEEERTIIKKGEIKSSQVKMKDSHTVNKEPEVTSSAKTGDFCFYNSSFYNNCNVNITIYKTKSNEVEKVIDVSVGENTCAYELPVGIHRVKLVWLCQLIEVKREYKEIKIFADKAGKVAYFLNF